MREQRPVLRMLCDAMPRLPILSRLPAGAPERMAGERMLALLVAETRADATGATAWHRWW